MSNNKKMCVCVCPCSSQNDLTFLFGIASINLFVGVDDRTNAGLCRLKLERGAKGYCLGVPCLTLAAILFSHPVCYLKELKSC